MSSDGPGPWPHENGERFAEALASAEARTGFAARVIEKDYYCSIVLRDLRELFDGGMVFRGGTCLGKVYTEFQRLSEDLDFMFPVPVNAPRRERREAMAPAKEHFAGLPQRLPCLRQRGELEGHHGSRQYVVTYSYTSRATGQHELVKLEVGLREPVLDPVQPRLAHTLLIDPFRTQPIIEPFPVSVLSLVEAYAEKFRAALTRREPAIRDFYDIDHAVRSGRLDPSDARLCDLVGQKLAVPGNDAIDVTRAKLSELRRQLEAELRPVLRPQDYDEFDLERAFEIAIRAAEEL